MLLLRVTDVHRPLIPPTDSIVYVKCQNNQRDDRENIEDGIALTKGDAVGPSRMASSSSVNGSRGTRYVLSGTSSRIMTGNPIAAVTRAEKNKESEVGRIDERAATHRWSE